MQMYIRRLLILILAVTGMGCAGAVVPEPAPTAVAPSLMSQSRVLIEKLDLNQKQLADIYQQMQVIAEGDLFYGSDEQLSTIQKSSLHILLSNRTARYQTQLLSALSYVGVKNRKDYLPILIKSLEQAVFDSAAELNNLNTHYAFIEKEAARDNIDRAVTLIRTNLDLYKQILSMLKTATDQK